MYNLYIYCLSTRTSLTPHTVSTIKPVKTERQRARLICPPPGPPLPPALNPVMCLGLWVLKMSYLCIFHIKRDEPRRPERGFLTSPPQCQPAHPGVYKGGMPPSAKKEDYGSQGLKDLFTKKIFKTPVYAPTPSSGYQFWLLDG